MSDSETDSPQSSTPSPFKEESAGGVVRNYLNDVRQLLFHPTLFFKKMPLTGGVSGPLAFALVTHWLGASLSFAWASAMRQAIGNSVQQALRIIQGFTDDLAGTQGMNRHFDFVGMQEQLTHWIWGVGGVIADPFTTLIKIVFVSFLVFVGARLFVTPGKNGAPAEISYESALRIVCYGMTPSILCGIPIFGSLLAYTFVAIATVIGAREVYRVGNTRALVVGLFPHVLLFAVLLIMLFLVFALLIKMLASGVST